MEPSAGGPRRDTSWAGFSTGWSITGTMLAGIAAWGAIGYLIDALAGTGKVFTAVGMVVGSIGATISIYLKHGRGHEPKG